MGDSTNIAWADSTFNPWIGCTRVSPGCDHCYASVSTPARSLGVKWGAGMPRHRTSDANWRKPIAWDRAAEKSGKPWRVFCASLADVFDNDVPAQWRIDLMKLICETRNLTWMLLTKRIGNAAEMLDTAFRAVHHQRERWADNVLPNVWVGATIVNQEEADRDIPKLLSTNAAKRFVSYEPALGPVDFTRLMVPEKTPRHDGGWVLAHNALTGRYASSPYSESTGPALSWVIVGGESDQPGMRARPFDLQWARDTVRQCREAGVPCFVKQVGSNARWDGIGEAPHCQVQDHAGITGPGKWRLNTNDRAGASPAEWPEDLRVQEFAR